MDMISFNSNPKTTLSSGGFSLIEVLVSLALFTIVVTMSVGTLLVLIDANGRAQENASVMTNLAFTLDSMTRDIRTGYNYDCAGDSSTLHLSTGSNTTQDCGHGGAAFAFTETGGSLTANSGGRIGFRLDTSSHQIERNITGQNDNDHWSPITAPDIYIDNLRFVLTGSDAGDKAAPMVTIFIEGHSIDPGDGTDFNLQTTIVQETLDL